MTADILPKVVAIRKGGLGGNTAESIIYDGPNDFDRICEFLGDALDGGPLVVELKREADVLRREAKSLRAELAQKADLLEASRAETARVKLGQVGQVDAVRKRLEGELGELRGLQQTLTQKLEEQAAEFAGRVESLSGERDAMSREVAAIKKAHEEGVAELQADILDAFIRSTVKPVKAVLITTKTDVPLLWQQLAASQSLTTSFGIVRHTQLDLIARFGTAVEALPRIFFFVNGGSEPVMYDGIVTLDALSSFLRESVEGGRTAMELRTRLDQALMDADAMSDELTRVMKVGEAAAEERERARKEEVAGLQAVITSLKRQLRDACAGAGEELKGAREGLRRREEEAAACADQLRAQVMAERAAGRLAVEEAVKKLETRYCEERYAMGLAMEAMLDIEAEIRECEKRAKTCERAVLRAASAVHVTLVRNARENERMRSSLSEFISDVAPSQVSTFARCVIFDQTTFARYPHVTNVTPSEDNLRRCVT